MQKRNVCDEYGIYQSGKLCTSLLKALTWDLYSRSTDWKADALTITPSHRCYLYGIKCYYVVINLMYSCTGQFVKALRNTIIVVIGNMLWICFSFLKLC